MNGSAVVQEVCRKTANASSTVSVGCKPPRNRVEANHGAPEKGHVAAMEENAWVE